MVVWVGVVVVVDVLHDARTIDDMMRLVSIIHIAPLFN